MRQPVRRVGSPAQVHGRALQVRGLLHRALLHQVRGSYKVAT